LLGGVGEPIQWHQALREDATVLTVKSVLRLVHYNDDDELVRQLPVYPSTSASVKSIEFGMGDTFGRKDTFILRVKATFSKGSLSGLLDIVRTQRSRWDETCQSVQVLEEHSEGKPAFPFDIVLHSAISPKLEFGMSDDVDAIVPFCLLRTWQINDDAGTAILATQSILYDGVASSIKGLVRPSGWFLDQDSDGKIQVTYIAEHDLKQLRAISRVPDERIVDIMARVTERWFDKLQHTHETNVT